MKFYVIMNLILFPVNDSQVAASNEPQKTSILNNPEYSYIGGRICVHSAVRVKKEALDNVYLQKQSSLITIRLANAVWGYKYLAQACVRHQKNTRDKNPLQKRGKRAIKKQLEYILTTRGFPFHYIQDELSFTNKYFHHAIRSAKRKCNNYDDVEEDPDSDESDVEL